jgi:RNA polymerase sigma-70 factor, ECF subfamily
MRPSDVDLMLSIKDGDSAAFETLTRRHYTNTLNFIYRFVNNRTHAEDLCQETFLRLWRSAPTYQPLAKFTTFLYHIAKNVCLKQLAKEGRIPHLSSLDEPISHEEKGQYNLSEEIEDHRYSPEKTVIAQEADEAIRSAIDALSTDQRLVFVLTEFQGMSYQEVAEIVQCPIGTVASRKNSAVRQLQKSLSWYVKD